MYPRKRFGLAGVDPSDARVRMWAGQDLAVEHARDLHIIGKRRAAGDQFHPVHLADITPYHEAVPVHRVASATGFMRLALFFFLDAAANTASTGFWYPVQRHKCPARASRTSSSEGSGRRSSNALALSTMPPVQKPHCTAP